MALSLRHVADQLFSEVRIAKEKDGHCKYHELDDILMVVFSCLVQVLAYLTLSYVFLFQCQTKYFLRKYNWSS